MLYYAAVCSNERYCCHCTLSYPLLLHLQGDDRIALVNSCRALCTTDCTIIYHKALLFSLEVERTSLHYTPGCNGTVVCFWRMSYCLPACSSAHIRASLNESPHPQKMIVRVQNNFNKSVKQKRTKCTHGSEFCESESPRFGTDLGPTRFGIRLHKR